MHLSMHNWMRAEPIEVTIARLKKYGYESLEISGEPARYDTKEVKKTLDEHGIRCLGHAELRKQEHLGRRQRPGRFHDERSLPRHVPCAHRLQRTGHVHGIDVNITLFGAGELAQLRRGRRERRLEGRE